MTKYHKLRAEDSVHMQDYPDWRLFPRDIQLVKSIDKIKEICSAGLNIRNTLNIRTRQPLAELMIIGSNLNSLSQYFIIIEEEVNVKKVLISKDIDQYVEKKLKIHFPIISKRLPHKIKLMIEDVKNKRWALYDEDHLLICGEILKQDEFEIILEPKHSNVTVVDSIVLVLDTTITKELFLEGLARDVVRTIQQARKDSGFQISDRIKISINCTDPLAKAIKLHKDYICKQTLCENLDFELLTPFPENCIVTTIEGNDLALTIACITN